MAFLSKKCLFVSLVALVISVVSYTSTASASTLTDLQAQLPAAEKAVTNAQRDYDLAIIDERDKYNYFVANPCCNAQKNKNCPVCLTWPAWKNAQKATRDAEERLGEARKNLMMLKDKIRRIENTPAPDKGKDVLYKSDKVKSTRDAAPKAVMRATTTPRTSTSGTATTPSTDIKTGTGTTTPTTNTVTPTGTNTLTPAR